LPTQTGGLADVKISFDVVIERNGGCNSILYPWIIFLGLLRQEEEEWRGTCLGGALKDTFHSPMTNVFSLVKWNVLWEILQT
jgi:hypothetical protein